MRIRLVKSYYLSQEEKLQRKLIPTTSDISQKRHELHIWECTSISDVNNVRTLMFSKEFKFGQIRKINDEFIMGIGDNPAYLDMILEKLITNMHKQRINELALSSKDNIYEYVSSMRFKETYTHIYNKLLNKIKNLNLNIIIYEPLQRIKTRTRS